MAQPTERQVEDWLRLLGRLVASDMTPQEAGDRLRAYTPLLVERFSDRDFNAVSREWVARSCRFFPSYGELCELLDKWPRPSPKPEQVVDTASELDAADRAWVAFWHKRRAEIWAQQEGFRWGTRDADMANLANLVAAQSRKAWATVSGVPLAPHAPPSERERAAVAELLHPFAERSSRREPADPPRPSYVLKRAPRHLEAVQ
jgi:hypothetical protein